MNPRVNLLFSSDRIKFSFVLNSILFQFYKILIVENKKKYVPILIKNPGESILLNPYDTLKGAKIAVAKRVKDLCIKNGEKLNWTINFEAQIKRLRAFTEELRGEHLELKIRMVLLNRVGRNAFIIDDKEDLRNRHFLLPEDEKEIQGILDNFGLQVDIKRISPLSIENILASVGRKLL